MQARQKRWTADLAAWTLLCIFIGGVVTVYVGLGLAASDDTLIMPLDDTYIHFQYARQMAEGSPYRYHDDDPPTSGATSFLYSPLLAVGYLIGFRGLSLAYWAIALGVLSFLGSAWLIYRLILIYSPINTQQNKRLALIVALGFAGNGAFIWGALSGMETMPFVLSVLLTFYAYQKKDYPLTIGGAVLATLMRPEGGIVALVTSRALFVTAYREKAYRRLGWCLLPIVAIGVQPLVNYGVTGDFSATGSQAKSHLYNTTIPMEARLAQVWEFWMRLWEELLRGENAVDGAYVPAGIVVIALGMIGVEMVRSIKARQIRSGLVVGAWLLGLSVAISTLDTAFWHFKRYQLPMMAVMFPLAGWGLVIAQNWKPLYWARMIIPFVGLGMTVISIGTTIDYARRYRDNVSVVQNQQVRMAMWVNENTPDNARIGVHDVGVMGYVGERATYDLVGLTTDGTAASWRQGAGTIYEVLLHHPQRPDFFAVYHDIQSLPFLVQAGVLGEEMERFVYPLPQNTVASATATQVVTRADWTGYELEPMPRQPNIVAYTQNLTLLDAVNVGYLADEAMHDYTWWQRETVTGFSTELHRLAYQACGGDCWATDGGRVLTGGERFRLPALKNEQDYYVVMRVHAVAPTQLQIGCGETLEVEVVPFIAGRWVELGFWVAGQETALCVAAQAGVYQSYQYWIYGGQRETSVPPTESLATVVDPIDGRAFQMIDVVIQQEATQAIIKLRWYTDGTLQHDGKVFIHLYNDVNSPPLRQVDTWTYGTTPPANWEAGYHEDTFILPIGELATGAYAIGVGFYDPNSGNRYTIDNSDRWFIGTLRIQGQQILGG